MKKNNKNDSLDAVNCPGYLKKLFYAIDELLEVAEELQLKKEKSATVDESGPVRIGYTRNSKWLTKSISSEAYAAVFGSSLIPKDHSGGKLVQPGVMEIKNAAGTWVAIAPNTKKNDGKWTGLRLKLDGCNPDQYKTMTTRPYFRYCEETMGLNTSILRTWYFIRLKDSYRVARDFCKRTDLHKFGLKCLRGSRKKLFVVKDLGAFRTGLYREFGIENLPGDRGWMKKELGAAGTMKVEVER